MEAWGYPGQGEMMPRGVTSLMILLSGIWFVQSILALRLDPGAVTTPSPKQLRSAAMLVVVGLALLFGMRFVGFYTSAAIIVPLLGYGLGYRNLRGLAIGTAVFLVLLIAVFRLLLAVQLPPELGMTLIGF